jgi:hypothetical protein
MLVLGLTAGSILKLLMDILKELRGKH